MRTSPSTIEEKHILVPFGVRHAGLVSISSTNVPVDFDSLIEHVLSLCMLAFVAESKQRATTLPKRSSLEPENIGSVVFRELASVTTEDAVDRIKVHAARTRMSVMFLLKGM